MEMAVEQQNDLNQYVPKKAFNQVKKLNANLQSLKELTDEENPELLDTSTGVESFFTIIGDVMIKNGHLRWTQDDQDYNSKGPHEEDWNLIREDDEEGYWFDEYEFKDQVGYLNRCIKKAIKYFQEYTPEMDDNEEERNSFLTNM